MLQEKIFEMVKLQKRLNDNTNGENWINGVTKEGRKINWFRCIYMEAAEAIDSLNWKHWKSLNAPEDIENVKIEIVDIWHFILSQAIVKFNGDLDKTTDYLISSYEEYKNIENSFNEINLIDLFEQIIANSVEKEIPIIEFYAIVDKIDNFTMDNVYSLYIGKNCLNEFRQANGYKENTYIKLWAGKEDNVYMQEIVAENPGISFSDLYSKLEDKYFRLVKSIK